MNKRKTCLRDEQIISIENVKELGEKFALSAIRSMRRYEGDKLEKLYQGLVRDIFHFKNCFSEGYDVAQECICYLCANMGKKLGDNCINIYGKPDTIRFCCYKVAYKYLRKELKHYQFENIDETSLIIQTEDSKEPEDYSKIKAIIKVLKLSKVEKQILQGYFDKRKVKDIAEDLKLGMSTLFRKKQNIKLKFINKFGSKI